MESMRRQPSLEFAVKVVRVAGLGPPDDPRRQPAGGGLFVRYYVPAGDGSRRLRVDTREVPWVGREGASWGELARFQRWGRGDAAGGGIVFELRWRPPPSSGLAALLGAGKQRRPSRVLARAELAWPDAAAAPERWLALSPAERDLGGCKAPKLLVEVSSIRAAVAGDEATERGSRGTNECCSRGERCGQCGWVGSEEDMFLAATFS